MAFQKVATIDDVREGRAKDVMLGDTPIAIYKVDGQIYATQDMCPHAGASLGQGELDGCMITCPMHGWQFDVTDGRCLRIPAMKIKTYEVKVEGKDIFVDLGE